MGSNRGVIGPILAEKVVWMMREAFWDHFRTQKKFDKISLFRPPYTRRRSHRPFLCGHSGSEIGLYLVLVDTSEARTASKNTLHLRIYSKNIANSM